MSERKVFEARHSLFDAALLLHFNTAPEPDVSFDVGGLRLGVLIDPGGVGVLLSIDRNGEVVGCALPGADAGVRAGLQEGVLDRLWRKVSVSVHGLNIV